ncbi:MAG: transposase [Campylobacterota bacterium]|nr:transposase [Campylobacterota bacterium]
MSLFDEQLQEVIDEEKGIRYILRQNPIRRDEIRETRESKIKRVEAFIEEKQEYYNSHYRAKQETMIANIDKKIASLKLSKFRSYKITYQEGECIVVAKDNTQTIKTKELATVEIIIDQEAKIKVAQLDGCYVVTTSLTNIDKDTKEDIHTAYKTLIKVENAFKALKTEYLEIRPLYLRTDSRIKAHIFLSMLSYNIVLKLRGYIFNMNIDFKSTIRKISNITTVKNTINKTIVYETIPAVDDKLKELFDSMKFKLPNRI